MPRDGEDAAVAVAVERRARPPGDGRSGTRGLVRRERVLPHRRVAAPFAVVVAAAGPAAAIGRVGVRGDDRRRDRGGRGAVVAQRRTGRVVVRRGIVRGRRRVASDGRRGRAEEEEDGRQEIGEGGVGGDARGGDRGRRADKGRRRRRRVPVRRRRRRVHRGVAVVFDNLHRRERRRVRRVLIPPSDDVRGRGAAVERDAAAAGDSPRGPVVRVAIERRGLHRQGVPPRGRGVGHARGPREPPARVVVRG
mmetsp:Transcript_3721/g.12794  ORF Transcript_3721/g.12794 Transcript_3721/m.12794 type:complete len:250 (+) Transcript_3721:582-1331(+)